MTAAGEAPARYLPMIRTDGRGDLLLEVDEGLLTEIVTEPDITLGPGGVVSQPTPDGLVEWRPAP
ncbi:hypothetical protein [Catenuloplanes japonicus]|uniref:hypothetical protein n=1 Tax=Catenuloplanes japonicus TaxID=33876 RepID=UPI0005244EC9|nr:hypothetical protein [Catenuloplanes japonicus]